jgi:Family of unknown function (DUF6188)
MAYVLPLAGHAISDVEGEFRFELVFDDAPGSHLLLEGPFSIGAADGHRDLFEPPCPDWVRDVLLSLAGSNIYAARYNRRGSLRISFVDGRDLFVDYGPFENWRYSNANGVYIYGGIGRVSVCG